MNSNLDAITQAANQILTEAASAQNDIDSLGTEVDTLTAQIGSLSQQLTADQTTISQLQQQVQSLTQQLGAQSGVKVFDALELTPWLVAGGTAANTGSQGNTAGDSQSVPTNLCAYLGIAPNGPYADKYFYKTLGADATKSAFTYELRAMLALPTDAASSQAVELDIQQCINGVVYNTGLQFDFAQNQLRVWNRFGKAWEPTGVACPRWASGAWQTIKLETHRNSANVLYDAVTVNGVRTALNQGWPAPNLGLSNMLNCAIQLDGNSAGNAYRLYIDDVRFTAK